MKRKPVYMELNIHENLSFRSLKKMYAERIKDMTVDEQKRLAFEYLQELMQLMSEERIIVAMEKTRVERRKKR